MPLQVLRNQVTGLYFNGVSFAEKLLENASVQKNFDPVVVKHCWGEKAEIVDLCIEPCQAPTRVLTDLYGSGGVELFADEGSAARRDELMTTNRWERNELQIWNVQPILT